MHGRWNRLRDVVGGTVILDSPTPAGSSSLLQWPWPSPTPAATGRERRGREYLETLVNTTPVGVVVFDAGTGAPSSFNREARRIVDGPRDPTVPLRY